MANQFELIYPISGIGHVPQSKVNVPQKTFYEMMLAAEHRGEHISSSKQWTQIQLEAKRRFTDLAADMHSGNPEMQSDIVAFPDLFGKYSDRISPRIKRSLWMDPVLLQKPRILTVNGLYTLEVDKDQVVYLKNFPSENGRLYTPIKELGLGTGTNVEFIYDPFHEQGLRTIFRGGSTWPPNSVYLNNAPSDRLRHLAYRPILNK